MKKFVNTCCILLWFLILFDSSFVEIGIGIDFVHTLPSILLVGIRIFVFILPFAFTLCLLLDWIELVLAEFEKGEEHEEDAL